MVGVREYESGGDYYRVCRCTQSLTHVMPHVRTHTGPHTQSYISEAEKYHLYQGHSLLRLCTLTRTNTRSDWHSDFLSFLYCSVWTSSVLYSVYFLNVCVCVCVKLVWQEFLGLATMGELLRNVYLECENWAVLVYDLFNYTHSPHHTRLHVFHTHEYGIV